MADIIDWIGKLQSLGVAGLALLFLYLTARYFIKQGKEKDEKHEAEKKQIRADFTAVIEGKDAVIADLSGQLRSAAEQSRADMERHLERQVDATRRNEEVIGQHTAVIAQQTSAIGSLQQTVQAVLGRGGSG